MNRSTSTIEESLHVTFNELLHKSSHDISINDDDDNIITSLIVTSHKNTNISNKNEITSELSKVFVEVKNNPHDLVIGDISKGVQTRSKLNYITHTAFLSFNKPKNIKEAYKDVF